MSGMTEPYLTSWHRFVRSRLGEGCVPILACLGTCSCKSMVPSTANPSKEEWVGVKLPDDAEPRRKIARRRFDGVKL